MLSGMFLFAQLNSSKLFSLFSGQSFRNTNSDESSHEEFLHLFHEFNNFMSNQSRSPENLITYNYYDMISVK